MIPTYLYRTVRNVALVCFALSLYAFAGAGEVQESESAALWRTGMKLMMSNEAEKAYAVFGVLMERLPDSSVVLLNRARAAALTRRTAEAEALYRDLSRRFPDNPKLQLEAEQISRLLADAARGQSRLSADGQPQKRTQVSGGFRFGLIYDSNANGGPASEQFNFGNLILTIPGAKKRSTTAAYFGANVDIVHQLTGSPNWAAVFDAGLHVRGNANSALSDIKRREWQWGRVGAGIRYINDRNLFEVRARGTVFDYQFEDGIFAFGPEFRYIRAATEHVQLITQGFAEWRNYQRNTARDGWNGEAGQYVRILAPGKRHSVYFGGKLLGGDANEKRYRYNGWELLARMSIQATNKLTVSPHVSYTRERYQGPATIFDSRDRRDNRLRTGVDLNYRLNKDWSVEASYMYVKNHSSGFLNNYSQHVVSSGVHRRF